MCGSILEELEAADGKWEPSHLMSLLPTTRGDRSADTPLRLLPDRCPGCDCHTLGSPVESCVPCSRRLSQSPVLSRPCPVHPSPWLPSPALLLPSRPSAFLPLASLQCSDCRFERGPPILQRRSCLWQRSCGQGNFLRYWGSHRIPRGLIASEMVQSTPRFLCSGQLRAGQSHPLSSPPPSPHSVSARASLPPPLLTRAP